MNRHTSRSHDQDQARRALRVAAAQPPSKTIGHLRMACPETISRRTVYAAFESIRDTLVVDLDAVGKHTRYLLDRRMR